MNDAGLHVASRGATLSYPISISDLRYRNCIEPVSTFGGTICSLMFFRLHNNDKQNTPYDPTQHRSHPDGQALRAHRFFRGCSCFSGKATQKQFRNVVHDSCVRYGTRGVNRRTIDTCAKAEVVAGRRDDTDMGGHEKARRNTFLARQHSSFCPLTC